MHIYLKGITACQHSYIWHYVFTNCYMINNLHYISAIGQTDTLICDAIFKNCAMVNNLHYVSAIGQTNTFSQVYSLTNICLGSVVPFTILISLNTRIVIAVKNRTKVGLMLITFMKRSLYYSTIIQNVPVPLPRLYFF